MQENEFEKQVQQKIEELRLNPSAEVWQKVEVEIADNKRRRWLAFFIIAAILIGAVFFGINKEKKTNNSISSKNVESINNKNINEPSVKDAAQLFASPEKDDLVNKPIEQKPTFIEENNKIKQKAKNKFYNKERISINISNNEPNEFYAETVTDDKKEIITLKNVDEDISSETISTESKQKDSTIATVNNDTTDQNVKKSIAVVKEEKQKKKQQQWKYGVNFSAGIAQTENGYFGLTSNQAQNDYTDPSAPTNNPGVSYNSGKIYPGLGTTLGVFAMHDISKRSGVSVGINYRLLTTNIKVGPKTDSSFGTSTPFYQAGNSTSHHNLYHFIELPVEFNYNIGKVFNRPLYINAGVNLSQLISSNTLQFNNNAGIYYTDNKLLNKTTLGMSSGILWNIASNNKTPLLIGPDAYYSLTNFGKTGLYAKGHYSYVGIRIKRTLEKK